jgi:hypothetical protein
MAGRGSAASHTSILLSITTLRVNVMPTHLMANWALPACSWDLGLWQGPVRGAGLENAMQRLLVLVPQEQQRLVPAAAVQHSMVVH